MRDLRTGASTSHSAVPRPESATETETGAEREPVIGPEETPPRSGPMEGILQELIRRAATIGLGGFFLTEEAIRRAFSDVVPQEWVRFVVRQSQDARGELIGRVAQEFGAWLRTLDPRFLAETALNDFSFSIRIEVAAKPRRRRKRAKRPKSREPEEPAE